MHSCIFFLFENKPLDGKSWKTPQPWQDEANVRMRGLESGKNQRHMGDQGKLIDCHFVIPANAGIQLEPEIYELDSGPTPEQVRGSAGMTYKSGST
jgi:hypothetical protein